MLARIPSHMAYNVSVVDARGELAMVAVAPDQPASITRSPVATNHQADEAWTAHATRTHTHERESFLRARLGDPGTDRGALVRAFLAPPLYATDYEHAFGTLYTAAYAPASGAMESGRSIGGVAPSTTSSKRALGALRRLTIGERRRMVRGCGLGSLGPSWRSSRSRRRDGGVRIDPDGASSPAGPTPTGARRSPTAATAAARTSASRRRTPPRTRLPHAPTVAGASPRPRRP